MSRLVIEALLCLLRTEWHMYRRGIESLHQVLRKLQPADRRESQYTAEQMCRAMDIACMLYFKHVLCLQRSSATVILLRHRGLPAKLVIAARIVPFDPHAWAELEGRVINDKEYMPDIYRVLERC